MYISSCCSTMLKQLVFSMKKICMFNFLFNNMESTWVQLDTS